MSKRGACFGSAIAIAAALSGLEFHPAASARASSARSGGIFGYSGNPAHNGGQICSACHLGGVVPTVTLEGPTLVQAGRRYVYRLHITGGQMDHGGMNASVTAGQLFDLHGENWPDGDGDELTHITPKQADGAGEVHFEFEWLAPAAGQSVTLYAAGNSVNFDGTNFGDQPDKDQLAISVEDCLVSWSRIGSGTAGSGGFVPQLDGVSAPCAGGASMEITEGLGGTRGTVWISDKDALIPFLGGNLYLDLSSLWIRIPIKLGGPAGVPGAGALSLPAGDLSFAAGLSFYVQCLFLDSQAFKGLSLSNAVRLDIGV